MLSTSKLVVAPGWETRLHAHGLNNFDALDSLSAGDIVKRGHSTEVRRFILDDHTLYLKKYRVTKANQLISGVTRGTLLGRSKVRREFENLQRLRQWGLDAPAPVAWGEERRAGWLLRSCLITESVPHPVPLDRFIVRSQARSVSGVPASSHATDLPSPNDRLRQTSVAHYKRRQDLLHPLADYVRRLHEHRFEHHDLYWRNIILSGGSLDHFYLIDPHKGRIWRGDNDQRYRAQDLATLDAPAPWFFRRTERLRFFLRYRQHARLTTEDKALARLTLQIAEPMRARQLARVRNAHR